jgi:hypothetical protein
MSSTREREVGQAATPAELDVAAILEAPPSEKEKS